MKLTSPAFSNGEFIPKKYTCDGENINPPLIIEDVPKDVQGFVLIVDDPDAPHGTFGHWALYWLSGVGPHDNVIPENARLEGAKNDFGSHTYGGPCPPRGKAHTYRFKLYALNLFPKFEVEPNWKELEETIQENVIAKAELHGKYQR